MLKQANITTAQIMSHKEASELISKIKEQVNFEQRDIVIMGKRVKVPRLEAWFGQSYTYSGNVFAAKPMPAFLVELKADIEERTGQKYNSVLINLYRDGSDSVSWHSDNEKELGADPVIASVSLGAERKFKMKHRTDKDDKADIIMKSGSLLVMGKGSQLNYLHCVPKTKKVHTERINLTFRNMSL